jgi:hypothetical protein
MKTDTAGWSGHYLCEPQMRMDVCSLSVPIRPKSICFIFDRLTSLLGHCVMQKQFSKRAVSPSFVFHCVQGYITHSGSFADGAKGLHAFALQSTRYQQDASAIGSPSSWACFQIINKEGKGSQNLAVCRKQKGRCITIISL